MQIQTINPSTEAIIQTYTLLNENEAKVCIDSAHQSFLTWRTTQFTERQSLMLKIAKRLREKQSDFACLMAEEMGKPIQAGKNEIEKCAWVCEYYATHAEAFLKENLVKTDMKKSLVCYQPLGVIFAIMPWNFPFWQVFRFAAPTLMAGNTAILKHAPISAGAGNAIAALFKEVGFPDNVFQHVIVDNDVAAAIIADEKIRGVSLTGSERAGSIVAANAAKHIKKAVLELGGSDPYLILHDADLEKAADAIVTSRLNNTGQTCISAKRIIVVKEVVQALIQKITSRVMTYEMGDPLDPKTQLGPLARKDLRDTLHKQVLDSIAQGATLKFGGKIPATKGFYYPPTLLTDVQPGMTAFEEELFGPVLVVITAQDEKEAIKLANQHRYGLGAAVFTQDLARGEQIATYEIEAGTCFVNAYVASDPRLPFGGTKRSGFGRELAREGILEFVNTKTVGVHD